MTNLGDRDYIVDPRIKEDTHHFHSVTSIKKALDSGTISYDSTHPIRILMKPELDGSLMDTTPLGSINTLATSGILIHPFDE